MEDAGAVLVDGAGATSNLSSSLPASIPAQGVENAPESPSLGRSMSPKSNVTPKKRGATAMENEDDAQDDDYDDGGEKATPSKKKRTTANSNAQRKRKTPAKPAIKATLIGRTDNEVNETDRKMIEMRKAGHSWKEIQGEIGGMGFVTAESTLPNRYARLMVNLASIKDEDKPRMFEAKLDVEAEFEKKKWEMIAQEVTLRGGDTYEPNTLQRQYKKLMMQAGATPPPGVRCMDFEIDSADEDD